MLNQAINLIDSEDIARSERVLLELQNISKPGSFHQKRTELFLSIARYKKLSDENTIENIRKSFKGLESLQSQFSLIEKRGFDRDRKRLVELLKLETLEALETLMKSSQE